LGGLEGREKARNPPKIKLTHLTIQSYVGPGGRDNNARDKRVIRSSSKKRHTENRNERERERKGK